MAKPIDITQVNNPQQLTFANFNSSQIAPYIPLGPKVIDNYDAEQRSQYSNSPFGGYDKTEDDMAAGQSSLEQWKNGLSKAVVNIPLKFMEGMGYAYGAGKWLGKDIFTNGDGTIDDMINNDFAKWAHGRSKDLDKALPIFGSFDYQQGNILQKMSTAKFWAGDFTDGLAFLASAYGGSLIGKGVGGLLGTSAEAMGAAEATAASINKWSSFASGTIYNTVSESGFEAKDGYDNMYPELLKKYSETLLQKYTDPSTGELLIPEEQLQKEAIQLAKNKAGEHAANIFKSNLAILSVSNAWQMKAFMGNPIDETKSLWRKIVNGEIKQGEISAWKQAAKGFGIGLVSEGLWEEGIQNAIQQYQKKKSLGKVDGNGFTGGYFNEWLKGFSDTEGQASMILGALIGGPFQAMSNFGEAKEKENQIGFLTKEVAKQKEYILASDKIFQGFMEGRYKKDETGKIKYDENNNPILNEEWYKEKAYQIQLDEDYQKEKITALLNGDMTAAHVVDQYYTSRKLWNYLANPLYESTNHAFEAFQKNLETQGAEYLEQSKVLEEKRKAELEANDQPFSNPVEPLGQEIDKDKLEKQQFAKDMETALFNAKEMKSAFDEIQKNVKVDFFDSKSGLINEKLSKALFHEATKRMALKKALSNPALSEDAKQDILDLIISSEEFTKELYSKEGRKKYITGEQIAKDILENKIKEFNDIIEKYKEQPETEVKKSKANALKDKAKGLIKPILSKFEMKKAQEAQIAESKKEEKKPAVSLEDKMSAEDKIKLKQLSHDIHKNFYQHGDTYLNRINNAYGSDVAVGKKYQYYKELGDEEIRKSKLKDNIDEILSQFDKINFDSLDSLDEESYVNLQKLLYELSGLIQNYIKEFNEEKGYSKTNYTSTDLKYIQQIEEKVNYLLKQFDEAIDLNIKKTKELLSEINGYVAEINDFLNNTIDELNNFQFGIDSDLTIDSDNIANEAYALFGKDLIYYSFMNNYFISKEEYAAIKKSVSLMKLSKDEILGVLFKIIDNNGIADSINEEIQKQKHNLIQYLLTTLPEPDFDIEEALYQTLDLTILEKIKIDFTDTAKTYSESFSSVIEDSKKHVNSNKFLQMYKKTQEDQDEFYEALFIEENPEYAFATTSVIVEAYKKNFKEKNQAELDKIEDVFFYQNRLETLKDVYALLEKDINSKVLQQTKSEIQDLINTLENHIIPLAIKNQGNRKVAQEISLGIRDKSYFNQLGLDVEIALTTGQVHLKGNTPKLTELIKKIYGLDISTIKISDKFNFLLVEKILSELRNKPKEELSPLFDLIKELKQEVSKEIQNFENARKEARFFSSTNFDDYLNNPDTVIERLIYEMSDYNNEVARTYTEKENWFSSPLYNYGKHLSPALLLDELKKKKFSGSTIMPFQKLVDYIELHLEYTALVNLEKNLTSDLSFVNYFKNLRETFEKEEFTPTYQQEIALKEAYQWWNNPKMILSYLKGVAGTGKTSVFLKYFIETNKIKLDSVLLSAHDTPQVNALKGLSPEASGILLADLLLKDKTFFDKTSLLVIDEINANSEETIKSLLDKITVINNDRAEDKKLKVLFLGDPTQLKATNKPFIEYFSSYANTYAVKYGQTLKVFSPLTVAYRSDVGAINGLSTAFRDTNSVIKNIDLQSSAQSSDANAKGAFLSSQERTNGTLNDIFKRLEVVKTTANTKAIIVSNEAEVALYTAELAKRNISNVEVLQITQAQGRTFDEVYVDIDKNALANTKLGQVNKSDPEYFYNTAMYTAVSRAKNVVMINDNGAEFTHSIDIEVTNNNTDLIKEKAELKQNMKNYLDFADSIMNDIPVVKPEPIKPEEPPIIVSDPPLDPEEEPGTNPGDQPDPTDDFEPPVIMSDPPLDFPEGTAIHTLQNVEYNVLTEPTVMGVKQPALAQEGNEVVYMKSSDGHIYVYFKSDSRPNFYDYITTIYYKNLRDDVPSEKQLKDNYNANTSTRLTLYDKDSIEADALNRNEQIASGQIHHTQRLQFLYEKFVNKKSIEKEIAEKGGLYAYLQEKLLPLILKKDSDTETYDAEIKDYYVFIPRPETEKLGRDPNLLPGISNIEYGQPYIRFVVEKTNDKGQKRSQYFYVKLEAPMLHKNDSLIAPLVTFYNSIVAIENELSALSLPELRLGTGAFNSLLLEFKNDFTSKEDGKEKNFKGEEVQKYTIVPKDTSEVTKEDVQEILKDYNIKDEDLDKILAIFQKESKNLIPLLYSSKKDKVRVSAIGYGNFLMEQRDLGNVDYADLDEYNTLLMHMSVDDEAKELNDIILNKVELNTKNVIRSFRSSNIDINALNDKIQPTVRAMRKQLTAASFVPIIAGPNKGMFYAFDPLIGQVVVISEIPKDRFISRFSEQSKNFDPNASIKMFDYEEVRLTKRNSPVQTAFNIIARTNKTLNRDTPEEIKIQRSYTHTEGEKSRAVLFAPTLVKESKYDYAFDKKYYTILKRAFNDHIDKLKAAGLPFEFKDLAYVDDYGNTVSFQYHESISAKTGQSIWKSPDIVGKFRKEAQLQHEDALELMKQFLIQQKATIISDSGEEIATQELFDNMENSHNEPIINSKHLAGLVGENAFDESGSSHYYRKNVDRDYIASSQNEEHGGTRFENNQALQNAVTTRLKGVVKSQVQVRMNGVNTKETVVTPAPVVEPTPPPVFERKVIAEEGLYSIEQLENGKFGVFNNSEFPQEYIYDSLEDAMNKYKSFFQTQESVNTPEQIDLNALATEDYKKVASDFVIKTQEIADLSEVQIIEKSINKMFQKPITFDELINKIVKKYNVDKEIFQREIEGYYSKNKC